MESDLESFQAGAQSHASTPNLISAEFGAVHECHCSNLWSRLEIIRETIVF